MLYTYFIWGEMIICEIETNLTSPGAREPGGSGGVGPPLELEIYIVKISKIRKIYIFS